MTIRFVVKSCVSDGSNDPNGPRWTIRARTGGCYINELIFLSEIPMPSGTEFDVVILTSTIEIENNNL